MRPRLLFGKPERTERMRRSSTITRSSLSLDLFAPLGLDVAARGESGASQAGECHGEARQRRVSRATSHGPMPNCRSAGGNDVEPIGIG